MNAEPENIAFDAWDVAHSTEYPIATQTCLNQFTGERGSLLARSRDTGLILKVFPDYSQLGLDGVE